MSTSTQTQTPYLDVVAKYLAITKDKRHLSTTKKADKFFPPKKRGEQLSQESMNLLLRIFFLEIESIPESYNNNRDYSLIKAISNRIAKDLALKFGITERTVIEIIEREGKAKEQRYSATRDRKGEEHKDFVQEKVIENLQKGDPQYFTNVHRFLQEKEPSISYSTARRRFIEWGGWFEQVCLYDQLKQRDYVQQNKREFLIEAHEYLSQGYKPVFVDESFIYEKTVSEFSLTIGNVHLSRQIGKGKRVIMFGALCEEGWVGKNQKFMNELSKKGKAGSISYWIANAKGDYHDNFNKDVFLDLFEDTLLKKLPDYPPCLILLDRAKYHTFFSKEAFNPKTALKDELKDFLYMYMEENEEYKCDEDIEELLKPELLEKVLEIWTPPPKEIENLAEEYGHKVLTIFLFFFLFIFFFQFYLFIIFF